MSETCPAGVRDAAALSSGCRESTAPDPPCYEEALFKRRSVGLIRAHDAARPPPPPSPPPPSPPPPPPSSTILHHLLLHHHQLRPHLLRLRPPSSAFAPSSVSAPARPLFLFHAFHALHTPLQVPRHYLAAAAAAAAPFHFDDESRWTYSALARYTLTKHQLEINLAIGV